MPQENNKLLKYHKNDHDTYKIWYMEKHVSFLLPFRATNVN